MEQVKLEQNIYSAAISCRLSKDDEQAGESVSIETQKMMLQDFCQERGFPIYEICAEMKKPKWIQVIAHKGAYNEDFP